MNWRYNSLVFNLPKRCFFLRRDNICILVCYKKADKMLWYFLSQNVYNHYKLCADEKGVSTSLILNFLIPWRDTFGISAKFSEIRENSSSKKFVNNLFVKINPRQNKQSYFARISRICTNQRKIRENKAIRLACQNFLSPCCFCSTTNSKIIFICNVLDSITLKEQQLSPLHIFKKHFDLRSLESKIEPGSNVSMT